MARTQPSKGRTAIDLIKLHYEQGFLFKNAVEGAAYLQRLRPDVLGNCTPRMFTDYDRQARYEMYRLEKFVTHPIKVYEFERTPNANRPKRRRTRRTRILELQTRIHNETLAARAAAAQLDASQGERDQVTELEMMTFLIDRVAEKSEIDAP